MKMQTKARVPSLRLHQLSGQVRSGLGSDLVTDVYAAGSTIYAATSGGLSVGVQAVPEPSTYALALAGLACGGYVVVRRRTRV